MVSQVFPHEDWYTLAIRYRAFLVLLCLEWGSVIFTESKMRILVTGAAGFIGFHVVQRLLADGHAVTGIDNLNDYYDVSLKIARLEQIRHIHFDFEKTDIADRKAVEQVFERKFDRVIHLAAQSGVRWSISNPHSYVESNLVGFVNVLECCRQSNIAHLVYASSSSVYGNGNALHRPLDTSMRADAPISLYAATKRSNELCAHSYAELYKLPVTGIRLFTVYGAWGRPDMAYSKFTCQILRGEPVDVYNGGELSRDFTYIDDVVECVIRLVMPAPERTGSPARLFNAGTGKSVRVTDFISEIERALGRNAEKRLLPMQLGDVRATWANTDPLFAAIGYRPATDLRVGIGHFVEWYRTYYADS